MRTYNLNKRYIKDLQQRADRNDGSLNPKMKGRITRVNLKTQFGKTYFGEYWIDWDNPVDLDYFKARGIDMKQDARFQQYSWITINMGCDQYGRVWFPIMYNDTQLPWCPISKDVGTTLCPRDDYGVVGLADTNQMLVGNAMVDNG